jgi:hypothetical protein
MFKKPDIDTSESIEMVVYVLKLDNGEYVPYLELKYPEEMNMTMETLLGMREGLDFTLKKLTKVIDSYEA